MKTVIKNLIAMVNARLQAPGLQAANKRNLNALKVALQTALDSSL